VGVGVASEIEDFLRQDVPRVYPELSGVPSVTIVHKDDHILNVYDQRISSFADAKLKKDNVRVLTGRVVLEAREGALVTRDNASGKEELLPFGLCIWTTGLGTEPFTRTLQRRLGQGPDRRAISVDQCLRVRGAKGIYAMGDCADVKEGPALADTGAELFERADVDGSGTIDGDEFQDLLAELQGSHPHVKPLLESGEVAALMERVAGSHGGAGLGRDEFQAAIERVDQRARSYPSTAQVASQQGAHLAKVLNGTALEEEPFKYKHLGSFVQLGGSQAAMQMPGDLVWTGFSTMALWYGAYFSEQVSWRNRWLVLGDWLRVRSFGRDNSRI